jgi:hypothetical protein
MALDTAKTTRSLELFHFAVASAIQCRASLRCYWVAGNSVTLLPTEAVLSPQRVSEHFGSAQRNEPAPPALERIPWRTASLRVWISDLLYPGQPSLHALASSKGRGVLLAPWSLSEGQPDWDGNLELIDCETRLCRNQRVEPSLLADYQLAYTRHFDLWREHARKQGVSFARVPAEPPLLEALRAEALQNGAVEIA